MYCSSCGEVLPGWPPVRCAKCGADHWNNPKPCASAAVSRNQDILLVRRAHEPWIGTWDIPGGFCNAGEHPIETAHREVREETGLEIAVKGLLGMWMDTYGSPQSGEPIETTLNIYYHARLKDSYQPLPDPNEVSDLAWFNLESLPEELAFPNHIVPALEAWRIAALRGWRTESVLPGEIKSGRSKLD